jgi:hypothetical protein
MKNTKNFSRKKISKDELLAIIELAKTGDYIAVERIGILCEKGKDPEGLCEKSLQEILADQNKKEKKEKDAILAGMAVVYLAGNIEVRERNQQVLEEFVQQAQNTELIIALLGAVKK